MLKNVGSDAMGKNYVLFNPLANNGKGEDREQQQGCQSQYKPFFLIHKTPSGVFS